MKDHPQTTTPARRTILLVDDDPRVRWSLVRLLRWSGRWEVIGEAANGASALELAAMHKPDLVLLDLQMPQLDGFGVVRSLRAGVRPLIIFVTAYQNPNAGRIASRRRVARGPCTARS